MKLTIMRPTEIEVSAIRLTVPVDDEDIAKFGFDFAGIDGYRLSMTLDLPR